MLSSAIHHQEIENTAHSATIFPNVVIDNIQGLSPARQIQRIQFKLKGMDHFFHYQHAESLRSYQITPEQVETLRTMRYSHDRESDIFAPREVYVVHEFPVFLNFRVDDRVYQVWSSGHFTSGNWNRIQARIHPVGEIAFDEPVTIETALDRIWEWQRFFAQMAMIPVPFEAISVRGSLDIQAPSANLYLPNMKRNPKPITERYELSPRHLGLNFWADRAALGVSMQAWLARDRERSQFRVKIDKVIARMNGRIDPSDLVELSSAVDSLNEITTTIDLPEGALNSMVNAAYVASEAAGAEIERDRISGLLGGLQRPSLTTRFAALGERVSPPLTGEDAVLLARSATAIRNASAHGGALNEQTQPRVSPTVQALTALCARFDLETSGIPSRSSAEARTMTKLRFDEGLEELQSLTSNTIAPASTPSAQN